MARSRRKTPIVGNTTAKSDRSGKRAANRRFRAKVRRILRSDNDVDEFPTMREVSDVWDMPKDGKGSFDPDMSPQLMRK